MSVAQEVAAAVTERLQQLYNNRCRHIWHGIKPVGDSSTRVKQIFITSSYFDRMYTYMYGGKTRRDPPCRCCRVAAAVSQQRLFCGFRRCSS